jgi:transposase
LFLLPTLNGRHWNHGYRIQAGGRHREVDMREIVNAVRYIEATGCIWRQLPDTFPGRSIVWHYYNQWRETGQWDLMCRVLFTSNWRGIS